VEGETASDLRKVGGSKHGIEAILRLWTWLIDNMLSGGRSCSLIPEQALEPHTIISLSHRIIYPMALKVMQRMFNPIAALVAASQNP
jgi:hypothetical protein